MPIELAYKEYGRGPATLLLHGLFGSGTNWRSVARRGSDRRRMITVDLRNHGESPHTDTMDYPAMAADVRTLMDGLGLGQATVLGHSMGGKTAMQLALESPERVERLVVVDIAPVASEENHTSLIDAMQNLDLARIERRADADRDLRESIPEPGVRQFLLQNLIEDDSGFRWRIDLDAIERSMPELSGFPGFGADSAFPGEVLFVRGETSSYVRPEHHPVIRGFFPRARIESIEGAGHWVHADNPSRFLDVVGGFLDT